MKKTIAMLAVAGLLLTLPVLPSAASIPTFPHGTQELMLEGTFTLENHTGSTRADILVGYGYFVADNLEAGLLGTFRKTEWDSAWGLNSVWGFGLFGEYNIETGGPWLPFLGLRGMILDGNESSDTAFNGTGIIGLKLMMTHSAALTVGAYYDIASEDIYVVDRKPDNRNLTGKVGFRVFF